MYNIFKKIIGLVPIFTTILYNDEASQARAASYGYKQGWGSFNKHKASVKAAGGSREGLGGRKVDPNSKRQQRAAEGASFGFGANVEKPIF